MKKLYILVMFALFVGAGIAVSGNVHAVNNLSSVTSCEQVGGDIRISRNNGPKYMLTSSCRNAGYGMRLYKLTCTSATQYKTEWTTPASCTNTITPTPDVLAPTVSLTSNKSVANDNESVTLSASASDTKGVTKIEILERLVGGDRVMKTCLNTNLCAHTFVVYASGVEQTRSFVVKAYDAAGNAGTSSVATVRIHALGDSVKPEVTLSTNKTSVRPGEQIMVTSTASDASGISRIEISRNGIVVKMCINLNSCVFTMTPSIPTGLKNYTYRFQAKATDKNGNVQFSVSRQVTVTR